MLDRTQRMVERDKNRPERGHVVDGQRELGRRELRRARSVDPRARPVATDPLRARSRATATPTSRRSCTPRTELLEQIGRREEPRPDGVTDDEDARRRALPFLLCEYAHAMGNGPGSLGDYQPHPRVLTSGSAAGSCGSGSTTASRTRTPRAARSSCTARMSRTARTAAGTASTGSSSRSHAEARARRVRAGGSSGRALASATRTWWCGTGTTTSGSTTSRSPGGSRSTGRARPRDARRAAARSWQVGAADACRCSGR